MIRSLLTAALAALSFLTAAPVPAPVPADRPNPTGDGTAERHDPARRGSRRRTASRPTWTSPASPPPDLAEHAHRRRRRPHQRSASWCRARPRRPRSASRPGAAGTPTRRPVPMPYELDQIKAFRAAGGDVVVSFGGAGGNELAHGLHATEQLVTAYRVRDRRLRRHPRRLRHRGRGGRATPRQHAAARRRSPSSSRQRPSLVVTYTIQTGRRPGRRLAHRSRTPRPRASTIAAVNLMTMDYYEGGDPTGKMGDYAIQAAAALHGKLATLYPDADRRAALAHGRDHADGRRQRQPGRDLQRSPTRRRSRRSRPPTTSGCSGCGRWAATRRTSRSRRRSGVQRVVRSARRASTLLA